jgi:hypothetical protein
MEKIKRYAIILLLFFVSLSLNGCPPPEEPPSPIQKALLLYYNATITDNISFTENSSKTISWNNWNHFLSGDGITYSLTTIGDNEQKHYITITISNPHVQVYNETSSDLDIQYCNGAPFYKIVTTRPFTLEITQWGPRAVGTFCGTLEHRFDNTKTVTITDGTFDVLVQ